MLSWPDACVLVSTMWLLVVVWIVRQAIADDQKGRPHHGN